MPISTGPPSHYLSVQDWVSDIRPYVGLGDMIAELKDRKIDKGRVGLTGFSSSIMATPTLFHGDVQTLERELPGVEFFPAGPLFEEMRLIKSTEELAMLTEAGRIARLVVDAFIEIPEPGMTEAAFYAEIFKTKLINGAEPQLFFLKCSGPAEPKAGEFWHILHGVEPSLAPSQRPFEKGDVITAEWHTQYCGYLAAAEFGVYLGKKAPDQLKNINRVAVEYLEISKEVMKPGNTIRQAWEAIREPARKAGLDYVELGFHGHGMASPEFPTAAYPTDYGPPGLNGRDIAERVFEEGMVIGNNIDLFDPNWRPDVGLHFGDMLVVRGNRAEPLVNIPLELPEIG